MANGDKLLAANEKLLTIAEIRAALSMPLPGIESQIRMAPQRLPGQPNRWELPDSCREAGVLLLFYQCSSTSELHIVLIRRPEYGGTHSGQISLPGGQREAGETLQETALRETKEEIGILPETLEVIGKLSALYIPPSNFCIYPFVAYSPTQPGFQADDKEVAEIIETPLSLLFDPANRRLETWHFPDFGRRRVPFFDVYGHHVWGATAMILSEFVTLLAQMEMK